jgi:hypothetical protein
MLTAEQIRTFAERGWVIVPGLIAPDMLDALDAEVDQLVAEAPPPAGHVGHHFYWRTSDESAALFDPLHGGGALAVAAELVGDGGVEVAFNQAQVALNIRGPRGDVLFAHYLLGHDIGGNYETDRTRRALYWRLCAPGHVTRWEDCLVDPWLEYQGVRRLLDHNTVPFDPEPRWSAI